MFWQALLALAHAAVAVRELCGKDSVYQQEPYLWNNNKWNSDDTGYACTYVADTPSEASNSFEVLWEWAGAPRVRAFPHVEFKSELLPLPLRNLSSLVVAADWAMSPASLVPGASPDPNTQPNAGAIVSSDIEANVCIDIFADPDATTSQQPAKQMYEIMIWFGQFGSGALPVGNTEPLDPPVVALIQDTEFKLFTGTNFNGQTVHSWVANKTLTTFDMDFAPLLGLLTSKNMLSADVFMGIVQFGTETFSASNKVNFTVSSFEAGIQATNGSAEGSINGVVYADGAQTNSTSRSTVTGQLPVATEIVSSSSSRVLPWSMYGIIACHCLTFVACARALIHLV